MGIKLTGVVVSLTAVLAWAQPTTETTFPILQKQFNSQKDQVVKARLALALGVLAYKLNQTVQATDYLNQSLQLKTKLPDYAHIHLGLVKLQEKDLDGASKEFEKVVSNKPTSVLSPDAAMELARISVKQEKWSQAVQRYQKLERSEKGNESYPEILYELMKAQFKSKDRVGACNRAQKLFVRYPGFTNQKSWGSDLGHIQVDDEFFICAVTKKDNEKRIERLLLEGEFQQAKDELAILLTELRKDDRPHVDEISHLEWINARISWAEGNLSDVVTSITRIHDLKGRSYQTEMLLAKSYALMDEYRKAIMAYRRASQVASSRKLSNQALFQAAFLSYRNRDYDGASRSFEGLISRSRGQTAMDSSWHLAWIRYLKSDYEGAIKEFNDLLKSKYSTNRFNKDKIYYWRAMAELKLGHPEAARLEFEHLARQPYLSYYAGAAMARLSGLPGNQKIVLGRPAGNISVSMSPGGELARDPSSGEEPKAEEEPSPEDEGMRLEAVQENAEDGAMDVLPVTVVKDQKLAELFDRAHDLIELGFDFWAKKELRNIEKKTRNKSYLANLMADYARVEDYYRSAYIADVSFGDQREKGGVDAEAQLWNMAFPKAFSKYAVTAAKRFDVSAYLLWSVMRGESGYRETAHSGAGALGLMQLIPPTARRLAREVGYPEFSNEMLLNPEVNILFGARYLRRLSRLMNNQLPMVLGSYNAGPHRMQGWLLDFGNLDMDEFIEHIPYVETRNYIKKVLRNYMVYQILYDKKENPLAFLTQKPDYKKDSPKPLKESWDDIAKN